MSGGSWNVAPVWEAGSWILFVLQQRVMQMDLSGTFWLSQTMCCRFWVGGENGKEPEFISIVNLPHLADTNSSTKYLLLEGMKIYLLSWMGEVQRWFQEAGLTPRQCRNQHNLLGWKIKSFYLKASSNVHNLQAPLHLGTEVSWYWRENGWPVLGRKMQLWCWMSDSFGKKVSQHMEVTIFYYRCFTSRFQCILKQFWRSLQGYFHFSMGNNKVQVPEAQGREGSQAL